MTDSAGKYELSWYPKVLGEYRVEIILQEPSSMPESDIPLGIFTIGKNILLETISDHFLTPLTGVIVLQGTQ